MAKNWATNITFHDSQTLHPRSVEELSDLVSRNEKVRVRGTGHCFNTIADSRNTVVVLDALDIPISINEQAGTASVSAGINYAQISEYLHARGWALHNLASLPHISIGGAIATGTHGSGMALGAMHTAVRSIDLVKPDGSIQTLTPADNDFYAAVVGWGLTGIATTIEIAIEPTYEIFQTVYGDMPHKVFGENIVEILSGGYSANYFTTWGEKKVGDVWFKSRSKNPSDYFGARARNEKAHPIFGEDADACTEQLGTPGPWHLRLPHFRIDAIPSAGNELQTEFFVGSSEASAAFAAIDEISGEFGEKILVTEIRSVAADEHWMSPAYQRESVAFHFTWKNDYEIPYFVSLVEDALAPYSFRPHIGKVFNVEGDHFARVIPQFEAFKKYVEREDAGGKFSNEFTASILA